ncbi:MAG: DMT family transporter [Gemmatimonadales bacterium]
MSLPAFVWLFLALTWGSTWLFIKVGLDAGLPPVTFAGIRFVVASIPLVIWLLLRRRPLTYTAREWWLMALTGFLTFSMNYALVFWGETHISSGLAAILYTTFPISGILLAHWLLPAEPLTKRKVIGVGLAAAGVVLIFYNQIAVNGTLALLGALAIVLAALGTALADIIVKKDIVHIDPVTLTAVQMVFGFVPMLAIGIPLEGNPLQYPWNLTTVSVVLYLAMVGSALSFVLLYWLIQRMEVTRAMLIPVLSTLIAVILGNLVLGEAFTWRILVGGLGIIGGLLIATRTRPRVHPADRIVADR